MDRSDHWNAVFRTKGERDVSWFEQLPVLSIRMLEAAGLTQASCVIDVGGGDSRLVDQLLARGLKCLAVLDISATALERARARLGALGAGVIWIDADVTDSWSLKPMDIWHDRATFHFLIDATDRARYRKHVLDTLKPGGDLIIATFAPDGPERCSGLPVARYSPDALARELGDQFALVETAPYMHTTPRGVRQSFQYSRFKRHD
jgi:SAM-dependent methyltransferase